MKKRKRKQIVLIKISLPLVIFLSAAFLLLSNASAGSSMQVETPNSKISPAVQAQLNNQTDLETITVIVTLKDRADMTNIPGNNRSQRLQNLVNRLRNTATNSQRPVSLRLQRRQFRNLVSNVQYYWIFNGFAITARPEIVTMLSAMPQVESISENQVFTGPTPQAAPTSAPEANIALVNAPDLWTLGYTGQGIVIATMDTGVDPFHPDLAGQYRGGSNSWFDPYNEFPSGPADINGHGTYVTGIMVGRDAGGSAIGVAPDAQWIAARVFNNQNQATTAGIHAAYQWVLDPDGNPTTDDAPHVVNSSWSNSIPSCDLSLQADLQALRAAGIVPIFAAGNTGGSGSTSTSPGNLPEAFAVGAVNNTDSLYYFSAQGPSACGEPASIYPEIVAPGVNVRSTDLYGFYTSNTGTSAAAPHVSGALALLLQAFPNLAVGDQETALLNGTVDLGAAGADNVYGNGRLDILASYQFLTDGGNPTATPIPPTATNTPLPPPTATNTPLPPPPPTATNTPLPPPTATNTPLPPPTATNTPLPPPTATNTPLPPPTATNTPLPPPTATNTPLPPPTATNTPLPPPTATNTPLPPPTATNTPLPPPTATPIPVDVCTNGANILYIGQSQPLPADDQLLVDQLALLGHTLFVQDQYQAASSDANGMHLIIISDSVDAVNVSGKFGNVPVPLLTWESDLYSDLGLTGSTGGDAGFSDGQTQISITNGAHPLAAGYSGTTNILVTSRRIFWGVPGPHAITIAHVLGNSSQATYFAYESGALMVGQTAPARRVALFNGDSPYYDTPGWQLADAALNWSLSCIGAAPTATPLPPTATNTPLPPPTATNTPLPPPTATNTPLPPPTATNTPLPPPTATNTPLPPPTATNTPLPPPTATNTPLPPPTATNTPLPPPTATNTPLPPPTATNTPLPPPTATNTPLPPPTATNTPLPPPTATNTPLPPPTATNTPLPPPTATNTPLPPPTATNTPLPPPTATNTPLPPPTATNTPLPPPTATNTPLPTATAVPSGLRFETVTLNNVGGNPVTATLQNSYTSPVIVCTVNYANNNIPVVSRVRNVTANSFAVRLQNPGDGTAVSPETVHCLVMEEGAWTLPDGRSVEAHTYNSTITDENNSWIGQSQSYSQPYTNPVVVGQVMSENDPGWSVFWSRGSSRTAPPSGSALFTGKTVAEDSDTIRNNEAIGFIVFEDGIGTINGIKYEAALGTDSVVDIGKASPGLYTFSQSFATTPAFAVLSQAAMDGNNGGWAYLYGTTPLSNSQMSLAIDEDTLQDTERSHTTEQVAFVVFEQQIVYPNLTAPTPTATSTPLPPPTATNTPLPPPTATSTPLPPPTATSTPLPPPTATNTPLPPPTATNTPLPPPTATNTPLPPPTATNTPLPPPTATNTPLPPPTATSTPLPPPTATNTPLPPPTATNTPLPPPTATNTPLPPPTATNTPLPPPTATNTPLPPPTATNTPLPPPTATNTPLPPPTATSTPLPPPTATAVPNGLRFETVTLNNVGSNPVTTALQNSYISPVIVCTVNYANNTMPVVSRVRNVTSSSFAVRLQNPGDGTAVSPEIVHCLVVEEGAWTLPDGRSIEAHTYNSTITDENNSWSGQAQSYSKTYTNPVVIGQVMSENDLDWSVFWSKGSNRSSAPSSTALYTGKTVAEDTDTTRTNETIGFIVFEEGFGAINGIKYEAATGSDSIVDIGKANPGSYTFSQTFSAPPAFAVLSQAGMDGGNGGWAYLFGSSPLSVSQIAMAIDEDTIRDTERTHITEQIAYVVFEQQIVYPTTAASSTPTNYTYAIAAINLP